MKLLKKEIEAIENIIHRMQKEGKTKREWGKLQRILNNSKEKKISFEVKRFMDYHEIDYYADECKCYAQELGCFPSTDHSHWCYYAVFWTGRKPAKSKILAALKELIPDIPEDQPENAYESPSCSDLCFSVEELEINYPL
jgi:hypothetical protein